MLIALKLTKKTISEALVLVEHMLSIPCGDFLHLSKLEYGNIK